MTSSTGFQRLLHLAACGLILSACASAPPPAVQVQAPAPPSIDDILSKASLALNADQQGQALLLLEQAARSFPENKTPWLRIAQIKYDSSQYGEAIMNAQEAMLREPGERSANGIVALSGLRLSARALADLRRDNQLTDAVRTESQDLAILLRASLGETILTRPKNKNATNLRESSKKTRSRPAAEVSANPFSALK